MSIKRATICQMPQGGAPPTEFQVFPYGLVQMSGAEPFVVDEESMAAVVAQFQARGLDMVIDYEHQTEGRTEEYDYSSPDGRAPAAGWIKALENRGKQGLWAVVEWTEKAAEYLSRREYRYFSPVFYTSKKTRKLVELLRVALTNSPRLSGIEPLVAKNANSSEGDQVMEFLKKLSAMLGLAETAGEQEVFDAVKKALGGGEEQAEAAKELGLPATATGVQIIAALKSLKEQPGKVVACPEVLEAIGLAATASKSEIIASIHALKQRPGAEVLAEIASLKARLAKRDCDELVAAALKEGKITPAQKEWAETYATNDPEGFKLFVAKAPVVVPVKDLGGGLPLSTGGAKGIEEAQLQINKMLGISDEVWKKHNPPTAA